MALYAPKLNLPSRYREEAEKELIRLADESVAAHYDRDSDLADNDDLLEGVELQNLPSPYDGACTLNDVLPRELHTTTLANIMPLVYGGTIATCQSTSSGGKEKANHKETFVNDSWQDEDYVYAKSMQFSNMLRDKAGILYGGYCDRVKTVRKRMYAEVDREGRFAHWNPETEEPDDLVPAEGRLPGVNYEPLFVTQEEIERKAEYRAVNQINLYLVPPDAPSIEQSFLTLERRLLTADDLWAGISRYSYEEDDVREMIRLGPTHEGAGRGYRKRTTRAGDAGSENNDRENEIAGVETLSRSPEQGIYECFLCFGKMPKIFEDSTGKALLPEKLWETECTFMFCPQHHIVFMWKVSPFPWKPYTSVCLYPKNGRAYGSGQMDVVEPVAREATHWLRTTFNSLELEMLPERIMDDESYDRNKNKEVYPGKIWRMSIGGTIAGLNKASSALLGLQPLQDCRNRANTLFAAQGAGEIQTKVRKEAEIVAAMNKADSKTQLYRYFASLSIPEEAERRAQMEVLFNPDYVGTVDGKDGEMEITVADLETPVRWSVASLDADSTPEGQSRRAANILTIQQGYFKNLTQFPMFGEQLWNGAREALIAEKVREVETIIGTKEMAQMMMQQQLQPPMGTPMGMGGGNGLPPLPINGMGNGAVPMNLPMGGM